MHAGQKLLETLLEAYKKGEVEVEDRELIKLLKKTGLVEVEDGTVKFTGSRKDLVEFLLCMESQKIDAPLHVKIRYWKNGWSFYIPSKLLRELGLKKAMLLVNINGERILSVVGGKRHFFYIPKQYVERLNLKKDDVIKVVIERVFKPIGGGESG